MLESLLYSLIIEQAPDAPAGGQAPGGGGWQVMLITFIPIMFLYYFLLVMPNRKRERDRKSMLAGLKKNDHVVTAGGIKGVVANVKDDEVVLRIDEATGAKLRVVPSFITQVMAAEEDTPAVKKES